MYNTELWREYSAEVADIAQPVERILGKDEVPGPNPGISSTLKMLKNTRFWAQKKPNQIIKTLIGLLSYC